MCSLDQYNQQVLACQDNAYTLAWYLLEDESEVEAVVQKAVEIAFHNNSSSGMNCYLSILKQVAKQCQFKKPSACHSAESDIRFHFQRLSRAERLALVLIDILQLEPTNAALVMGSPIHVTRRLLANARWKLNVQMMVHDQGTLVEK